MMQHSKPTRKSEGNFQRFFLKVLLEIPIFGAFLIILNAWVLDDASNFSTKIASFPCWLKKFFIPIIFCTIITGGVYYLYFLSEVKEKTISVFIDLNLQIFSSLLAFGLAIFLIIFTLSADSIMRMMGSKQDAKLLCVQFSYPMAVWSINIFFSAILKSLAVTFSSCFSIYVAIFSIFIMVYSFILLFSMISSVFLTGMAKIDSE